MISIYIPTFSITIFLSISGSFFSIFFNFYYLFQGEINVEAGLGPKFDSLEKDLKSEGLTTMVEKIELLRKTIGENILADMAKNR